MPEVSLVAILDADKEGFPHFDTALIQTIGRAARHLEGRVIMYAQDVTGSMHRAIHETNRRRQLQREFNDQNGITPASVKKAVRDVIESKRVADMKAQYRVRGHVTEDLPLDQLMLVLADLERDMKRAARDLDFEQAAQLRDEIFRLKKLLPASDRAVFKAS